MSWELELATHRMEENLRWAANERLARQVRRERTSGKRRRGLRIEIHVTWDVTSNPAPAPARTSAADGCDDLVA